MDKHPTKTIVWKVKNVLNWFYDKWMFVRGYQKYGFNFKTNSHIYEKKSEIEKWENESSIY